VEATAGPDGFVGDAELFDLLEVEEALAIGEGVEGHDTESGPLGLVSCHGEGSGS